MSTQYQGVTLLGNTIKHIKEVHGLDEDDGEYVDILIEEYDMQVFDIETHGYKAIGYQLPKEMNISLSSVNTVVKLAKKFEQATGCTAKVLSCVGVY